MSDVAQNASYLSKSHLIHSVKLHKDGGVYYLRMSLAFEMMLRYFELRLERHVVGELFLVKTKGAPKGWKSTNSSSALRPLSCYYCIFW